MNIRTRFAPSPTGMMHVGNARAAVFAWLFARHHGGAFILRIEDTDRTRYVEGSVEDIQNGLRWLGLEWDEGPVYQSERLSYYQEFAQKLVSEGKAYRCWCSAERLAQMREEQKAAGMPTGYDRHCRDAAGHHSADEPHVVRFAMPTEGTTSFRDGVRGEISFDNALQDDFVMLKTDGFPTYQFANVVDDHLMEITHVIRSDEWVSSTPKHVQLYAALGWEPPVFAHPSLILGPDRSKLSKRHGAVSFGEYTRMGYLPDALLNFLALLGWSPGDDREAMRREELIEAFDIPGMVTHPAIFDTQKLDWINRQHIRMLPEMELAGLLRPLLEERNLGEGVDAHYLAQVCDLMKERLTMLRDISDLADYFFTEEFDYEEKGRKWLREPGSTELFVKLADTLQSTDWNKDAIEAAVRATGAVLGRDGGKVIHPVRVACTGRTVGPSLFDALEVLGRQRVVSRLRRASETAAES